MTGSALVAMDVVIPERQPSPRGGSGGKGLAVALESTPADSFFSVFFPLSFSSRSLVSFWVPFRLIFGSCLGSFFYYFHTDFLITF